MSFKTRIRPLNAEPLPAPTRRRLLKAGGAALALLVSRVGLAQANEVLAVRVWPADDYTRITIEGNQALTYTQSILKNPDRLVIDLDGIEFNAVLQKLPNQITLNDPYIKLIRAGRNRPNVVRLVIDLKTEIKPQLFTLKPVGEYGHRLVIDLYPKVPADPLMALLERDPMPLSSNKAAADTPAQLAKDEKASKQQAKQPVPDNNDIDLDKAKISRLVTIALDPGHGGEDPGAVGAGGSYEKNVTLSIAKRLKAKIESEANMRAMLTRDADFFVPLHHRVQKARRVQADLFVSIHADAFIKPEARGSSVFVLSEQGASSSAAKWLAQKENNADIIGGVNFKVADSNVARTLLDLSQTATINDSLKLGKSVLSELGGINTLHKGQVEQAGFAVLKAPDIPSILVETAFISNPEEEKRLNDEAYQDKMADAILRGIRKYFAKHPPPGKSKLA